MFDYSSQITAFSNQCHCCLQPSTGVVCKICIAQISHFQPTDKTAFLNQQLFFIQHLKPVRSYNTLSIGPHAGLLQHLINDFKYQRKMVLTNILTNLLADQVAHCYASSPLPQMLIPVPVSWLKRLWRGYNQTELLAQPLAKQFNIAMQPNLVSRKSLQAAQASLSGKKRRKLSPDTFRLSYPQQLAELNHVALLDDVITTGSTLARLAEQITKVNPIIKIDLWCLSISLQHP